MTLQFYFFLWLGIIDITAGRDTDIDIHIHLPWSPKDSGIVINNTTMPGFLMSVLWCLYLISLVVYFDEPVKINVDEMESLEEKSERERPTISFYMRNFARGTTTIVQAIFHDAAFPVSNGILSIVMYYILFPFIARSQMR